MKKSATYLLLAALAMLFAGCLRDDLPEGGYVNSDGTINLAFGITIPDAPSVATRTIGDVPDAANDAAGYLANLKLYIFVFEDTGSPESNYLRELVHGPKIKLQEGVVEEAGDRHPGRAQLKFTATFDGTAENAIFHIVATADLTFEQQLQLVADRSELGMFSGATGLCSYDAEAYWTRVELESPINAEMAQTLQTDKLQHLQLIRNFARVTVKLTEENTANNLHGFVLDGFEVINAADRGYVAAYNEKGSDGKPGFMTDFQQPATDQNSYYGYLSRVLNYIPARHPESHRIHPDDTFGWISECGIETDSYNNDPGAMAPKYLFERSATDAHQSFILVKGHFPNGGSRYIKLDIGTIDRTNVDETNLDEEGNPQPFGVFETFHVVRNVSYDVTITKMSDTEVGHTTAESAVVAPPSNNISTSIETRKMLNIYDGFDHMQVNATTIVIVDKDGDAIMGPDGKQQVDEKGNPKFEILPNPDKFDMKWRYYTDYGQLNPEDKGDLHNEKVRWNFPGYLFEFGEDNSGNDPVGIIDKVEYFASEIDPADSNTDPWRGFHLTFNKPDDVVRQKTVRLYSPFGLTRDVTFVMRTRWEYVTSDNYEGNVEVYPGFYSFEDGTMPAETLDEVRNLIPGPGEVGSMRGAQLTLMFELPNDVPQALFPLDFKIGFDRQNTENGPGETAVMEYGDTMFNDDGSLDGIQRMQFTKTVDWNYYNGSGEAGNRGHRLVAVKFQTTTDVLGSNESDKNPDDNTAKGETSTTRVRVTNPYFRLGHDSFLRSMKDNNGDPDPNQTLWSWYFGDPGWRQYLGGDTHNCNEESTYAGLKIKGGHTEVTRDGYAIQFAFPNAASLTSANQPEFQIDFDAETNAMLAEGGYTIKLTFTGASQWWMYNSSGLHINDRWYRRRPRAAVYLKGSDEPRSFPEDNPPKGFENSVPRNGAAVNTYYEGRPSVVEQSITINSGETLDRIVIWSDRLNNSDDTSGDRVATLWYGIRCEITPN